MNPNEYAKILYEVLENKTEEGQSRIMDRFKSLLAKNKDAHLAKTITFELEKIQNQKNREKTTYITSTTELSALQKQNLENLFPEPKIFSRNPSLLGGIAVRRKDKIHNNTLKKKVELLKNLLL